MLMILLVIVALYIFVGLPSFIWCERAERLEVEAKTAKYKREHP